MLLASGPEPFYTSLVFWAVATLIATILGVICTILYPYVIGARRRVLVYGVELSAPLVSRMGTTLTNLKVTLGSVPLVNPRTVSLRIQNRSRQDIGSADFDQGKPLILDVGTKIIGMGSSSSPVHPKPVIATDGSQVRIGPRKIGRSQLIRITVLVDGKEQKVTCESPLLQVDDREQNFAATQPSGTGPRRMATGAVTFLPYAAILIVLGTAKPSPHDNNGYTVSTAVFIVLAVALALTVVILSFAPPWLKLQPPTRRRRSRRR